MYISEVLTCASLEGQRYAFAMQEAKSSKLKAKSSKFESYAFTLKMAFFMPSSLLMQGA